MLRIIPIAIAAALAGCGFAPPPAQVKTEAPIVKDRSDLLPLTGRTGVKVVPAHLLDQQALPGGTVGDYETQGKKYQLFVIETDSNQKAAFLLLDMKGALENPEYLPNMGGYFGLEKTKPFYVFAKLRYFAGVVGLSKSDADPIARTLAARLR